MHALFTFVIFASFLAAPFTSFGAFSEPALLTPVRVGDKATLIQETQTGTTTTLVAKVVEEITGYSAETKKFSVKIVTTPASGPATTENQTASAEELGSQEELLKNCVQLGGTKDEIKVGSKTVATCKMTAGDPETERPMMVWFGSVPFALVRSELTLGPNQKVVTRLESFQFGNR